MNILFWNNTSEKKISVSPAKIKMGMAFLHHPHLKECLKSVIARSHELVEGRRSNLNERWIYGTK
jgi:hypothetical protein